MAIEYFTKDGENYVKVEEALHTQDHLDQVVKERAERIARKDFGDYDELKEKAAKVDTVAKEFEDKLKSAETEKSELESKLKNASLETEKVKIVSEFKLSDDLAEFVTGDNAEDMRKRAEKLASGVGTGKIPIKKEGKPADKETDNKRIAKELLTPESDDK